MISYLLLFCNETLTKITRPGKTPFPLKRKKQFRNKNHSNYSNQTNLISSKNKKRERERNMYKHLHYFRIIRARREPIEFHPGWKSKFI